MPHFIIEYGGNLNNAQDRQDALSLVAECGVACGFIARADIKARLISVTDYLFLDGRRSFLHVTVRMLAGRSDTQKAQLAAALRETLVTRFADVHSISVEICDMDTKSYRKHLAPSVSDQSSQGEQMKTMLKNLRVLGTAAVLGTTLALAAHAQDVTLRLHHFLPPQSPAPKEVLETWSAKVEDQSQGRIKVEIYPAMQLGGTPPELMDQATDGVADIVWTVIGYTPGRFPRSEVFELPFMMTDAPATSRAFWQMFDEHMKDTEFKDVHVLGTWVHGPGLFHSSSPIVKPSDLDGVKVRGGSRMINQLLDELGASPVGLPVPAVPEALSKGVIDATTLPWEVTASLKVPELVKNHTEFGDRALYTLTFVLAMNKDRYESLPDDLKEVIDDNSGEEFSVFAATVQEAADGPAREGAVKLGNNIITLDDAQIAEWEKMANPIYASWIADMNAKDIDGAALLEEARELIAKYTNK